MFVVQEGLSDVPSPSLRAAPTYGQHKGKGPQERTPPRQERALPAGKVQVGNFHMALPAAWREEMPSTSREEACAPPWNMVMEVLADLCGDLEELKKRNKAPGGGGVASHVVNTPPLVRVGGGASPSFSGFPSVQQVDLDGDSQDNLPMDSVFRQCAKSYGPVDEISDGIDKHVADIVDHVFDCGMREDKYKEIMEADVVNRPSNCPALAPVECNTQVLDALKTDARKADFCMKEVSKDIVKAATIITKSLTVFG
ncbi:hypothetical protein E2C01_070939 [Portunus trituberculatus]|uniref:Uncharacterized protein n=1 Tax=Portunus trituberculatus TaxID=210409 RepID=A0A5B7I2P5_PORTR|nr:hypothetical protein [Portunus trituberculatus]